MIEVKIDDGSGNDVTVTLGATLPRDEIAIELAGLCNDALQAIDRPERLSVQP